MKITIALIVFCLVLISCTQAPIKIGTLTALTGYGAEWGTDEQAAVQLAIDEANEQGGINGRQITLVSEDTKTETPATLTAFTKLTSVDDAQFIIGPTWESDATALAPVASKSDVVLVSPSSYKGIEQQNAPNLFSTYPPYSYGIKALRPYFEKNNYRRFVVLYHNEFFSQTMHDIFLQEAELNNWTVVGDFSQDANELDYKTTLAKIEALAPDAIYAPLANDDPSKGIVMKQMRELGINMPLFSTESTQNNKLLENYGDAIEGIIYPFPVEVPGYNEFEKTFTEKHGRKPNSPSAASAYDAANLIITALQNGAATPNEVSTYLHNVKDYPGASNTITFNEKGIVANKEHSIKTVKNGTFSDV